MKIMVAVKRVVDFNVHIRVRGDGSGVDETGVKMSMNPFDEIAVEEAVRLKEKGQASEIIVVSIGPAKTQDVIRTALAMGADRGIHVKTDIKTEPLGVAKILKYIAQQETPDLILLGKQAIDDDANQTAQMLAGLLAWGQGTFVSKLDVNDNTVHIDREIDAGMETISLKLPAVLSTDLRLNEPRFATLPNIMKAKKKQIFVLDLNDMDVDVSPRLNIISTESPPPRQDGIILESVMALAEKIKLETSKNRDV